MRTEILSKLTHFLHFVINFLFFGINLKIFNLKNTLKKEKMEFRSIYSKQDLQKRNSRRNRLHIEHSRKSENLLV